MGAAGRRAAGRKERDVILGVPRETPAVAAAFPDLPRA